MAVGADKNCSDTWRSGDQAVAVGEIASVVVERLHDDRLLASVAALKENNGLVRLEKFHHFRRLPPLLTAARQEKNPGRNVFFQAQDSSQTGLGFDRIGSREDLSSTAFDAPEVAAEEKVAAVTKLVGRRDQGEEDHCTPVAVDERRQTPPLPKATGTRNSLAKCLAKIRAKDREITSQFFIERVHQF
nr:hypothetical protein Iba_chr11cCG10310 [Ipomoea batatas]